MNTKWLMTASALLMGMVGIVLSFAPHEVLTFLSIPVTNTGALIFQVLGSLYFGFAMVNWMSRANLIGGIYSRPIAVGNLTHFAISAIALVKGYVAFHQQIILVAAIVYVALAASFAKVLFTHPVKDKN